MPKSPFPKDASNMVACEKHEAIGAQFVCSDCGEIRKPSSGQSTRTPRRAEPHPDWSPVTEIAVEDATPGMVARSTRSGAWCEEFVIGEIRVGKKNVTMLDEDGKIQLYLPKGTCL
jgi:hypothetical protein